jgi:cell division protein ZipA
MELRVILIVAGALLILALYLWEKYRRTPARQIPSVPERQPGQSPPAKPQTSPTEAPQEVITLHVISRKDLTGPDIIASLKAVDMQFGAMRIFHRHQPEQASPACADRRPVFSLANMVEPGYIPADEGIENFSTRGLALFMPLPNIQDGMTAFEDMLAAARQLAETLGAEVCDERRNILTLQALEHTRERIREWQRLQLLAQAQRS